MNKKRCIVSFLLAIFCVSVFSISQSIQVNPNSVITFIYLVIFIYVIEVSIKNMSRRRLIISSLFGALFSVILAVGNSYYTHENRLQITDKMLYFDSIALGILITSCMNLLLKYFPIIKRKIQKINLLLKLKKLIEQANFKTFGFVFMSMSILWILPFLALYPGYFSYDAISQLVQYHEGTWSAWQPVVHTAIFCNIVELGYKLFGSYSSGLTMYCLVQALFMISTFSYLVVFLAKRKVPAIVLIASIILFAINPIIQMLSFSTVKITFFSCFLVFLLIFLIEMLENPKEYFSRTKNLIKFMLVAIFMSLFRKEGVYILIFLLPIMLISLPKYWKKIFVMFFVTIIVVFSFFGPISTKLNIEESPLAEMLSMPIQQISAVVVHNRDSITEEDWKEIQRYFDENSFENYIPQIADPVKYTFKSDEFKQDKIGFIKLWLKLGFRNVNLYINAFVDMNIGYFYPSIETVSNWSVICPFIDENNFDIKLNSLCELYYKYLQKANTTFFKGIPFLTFFVCGAMPLWIILMVLAIVIYQKKYKAIVPIIPVLLYFCVCLLGPVCCIRYIYALYAVLPFLIAMPFMKFKKI